MWLEVLSGEDAGRVVEVDRPLVLGRVQGADLVIRDARASRRHAELTPVDGGVELRDLGSANGTLVGDERVREAVLHGGEEIRIGAVRIAVLAQEPAATGAPIAERVRPGAAPSEPSWSMIGRLVDSRTRRARRLTYTALAVAGIAVAAVVVLAVTGESDEERVAAVVSEVAPATLRIEAREGGERSGQGSGWVLDREQGLVVTAAHVINEGSSFVAGREPAAVAGTAPCEDLAVLRVDGGLDAAALELRDGGQGETVLAFGFPQSAQAGEQASSTRGVVSAAHTAFTDPSADVPAYRDAVRTDTALDPGFSGGPLVDLDGRVVGVNAAARTLGGDDRPLQGANYAIAARRARDVLALLRRGESIASIGVNFGYPSERVLEARGYPPGLFVRGTLPGSGAERAGLKDGDLIAAVNGRPLDGTLSGWCRATRGIGGGQTAAIAIAQPGGGTRTVDVRFD